MLCYGTGSRFYLYTSYVHTAWMLLYTLFHQLCLKYLFCWLHMFPWATLWLVISTWKDNKYFWRCDFIFLVSDTVRFCIWLPHSHQILAFHLALAFTLHLNALRISSCFSWAPYSLTSTLIEKCFQKTEFTENTLQMYLIMAKAKTTSWKPAPHLLSSQAIHTIHQYIKNFFWERGGGQSTNFIKVNREKVQMLLTTGLYQTLWVSTGLDQYLQKILAPKLVH